MKKADCNCPSKAGFKLHTMECVFGKPISDKVKYAHMNPPTSRWDYFWIIQIHHIWAKVSLWDLRHGLYSYWWLNIAKRKPLFEDEDQDLCTAWLACNHCGKGQKYDQDLL